MEIVNTSLVPAAEAIEFLLRGGGLARMIGADACACFVVSREIRAADFFDHLIRHVETIDSTTREHIAFIVFYGGSSQVLARAGGSYVPSQIEHALKQLDQTAALKELNSSLVPVAALKQHVTVQPRDKWNIPRDVRKRDVEQPFLLPHDVLAWYLYKHIGL